MSSSSPPPPSDIDPRSGFSPSNATFYSKRDPIPLPPNQNLDLTTFISARSHHHRNSTALVDATTGRRFTYSELWLAVESLSSALSSPTTSSSLGVHVRKGDVVLILSPNSIYFPVVCLSVMSLGAVITTTNPLNTPAEIAKQIADSKPVLAFTTPELIPKLAAAAADSMFPIVLISDDDDHRRQTLQNHRTRTTLADLISTPPTESRVRERITQSDTASLLYSSGTTGASKGVVSSHGNLIAMVELVTRRFRFEEPKTQQIFICTVPMFHIYGMAAFATGILGTGSAIVVLPKFEIADLFSAIEKYRVTRFPLVPPILVAMVNQAKEIKRKYDLSSLTGVLSGGAPLGKEVIEGFAKEYPAVEISQGYGLTESAAMGSSTDCLEENRRYGTAGMVSSNTEARIVEPDSGRVLGVGQTGELWLRGPTIMKGYFNNPEATAATLTPDGWLKTGDLCYIDEDGFLFVVDRLKELIKYKGYQVPPAELEALLLTHPQIADAAVIPYPDKEAGQVPMAYVVRKANSSLSEDSVMEFVAKQVAPYKRIRRLMFVNSIPKNASGKILRKDLIKLAASSSRL